MILLGVHASAASKVDAATQTEARDDSMKTEVTTTTTTIKTVLLYVPIHYCFYIPPIILNLLYFNVLVYCYFYFLIFCDIYVCVCVSDLNYPKQIVRLAACPF